MQTRCRVLCHKSKKLLNEEHPLYVCVTVGNKRTYSRLPLSVSTKHWNFKLSKPRTSCPNEDMILLLMADIEKEFIEKLIYNHELMASGKRKSRKLKWLSNEDFRKIWDDMRYEPEPEEQLSFEEFISKEYPMEEFLKTYTPAPPTKTVKEVFDSYIESLSAAESIKYKDLFTYTLNTLTKFNSSMDIAFTDINRGWLKKLETWLRGKGLKENSISIHFRNLRTIYNEAIQQGIVRRDSYPFDKDYQVSRLKNKTAHRALSRENTLIVINYACKNAEEQFAVDIFTFSYLAAGINFNDIARATKDNVLDGRLTYMRKKTRESIIVPLHPKAKELIDKYASNNTYLFPILSAIHKTEQQKINRITKVRGQVNMILKSIGNKLNLPIPLTTYCARHSFATALKQSGVPTALISDMMGHSDPRVTQIYLDSFGNDQMAEALKNLL